MCVSSWRSAFRARRAYRISERTLARLQPDASAPALLSLVRLPCWEPDQVLSAREALAGYTVGAAVAVGEENLNGRLVPGMRADLTAFAADPLEVSGDELLDVPITLTAVAGQVTHCAPEAGS